MKKLPFILLFVATAFNAFAQEDVENVKRESKNERKEARKQKINTIMRQAEEGVLVYRKQNIFGIEAKTNGYGVFYELGRMKSNRKTNIYRIDITETKSAKDEKLLGGGIIFW